MQINHKIGGPEEKDEYTWTSNEDEFDTIVYQRSESRGALFNS